MRSGNRSETGGAGGSRRRVDFDPAGDPALAVVAADGRSWPVVARRGPLSLAFSGFLTDGGPLVALGDGGEGDAAGAASRERGIEGTHGDGGAAVRILAAYLRHGERAFDVLRGHFTIVVWDAERRRLLALRDPIGMAPLFFAETGAGMAFASDIRTLLAHPAVSTAPSRTAIAESLAGWPGSPEETFFEAVHRVPPGHRLRWQSGHVGLERWWEPDPDGVPDDRMQPEDLGELDLLLDQAIRRATSRGLPGIFLSGGLDSVSIAAASAATAAASRSAIRRPVVPLALSLAFPHPECDEVDVQRGVATALGLDQTLLPFDDAVGPRGLIMASLDLSAGLPAPLQNPWRPAYITLAERGRDSGCRVILTGSGGDDWLTVNSFYMADLIRQGRLLAAGRFVRRMQASYSLPASAMARYLVWTAGLRPLVLSRVRRLAGHVLPQPLESLRMERAMRSRRLPDWLAPDRALREEMFDRLRVREMDRIRRPEPGGPYGFYTATSVSRTFAQPSVALELEEDWTIGRLAGLDLMHPYWDPDLIRFLCRVPPRLLLAGGREKSIVRRSVARRFPDLDFERRRKVSASDFFYGLLRREAPTAYSHLKGFAQLAQLGIVGRTRMDAIVETHLCHVDIRLQHYVWHLLVSEAWLRQDRGAPRPL